MNSRTFHGARRTTLATGLRVILVIALAPIARADVSEWGAPLPAALPGPADNPTTPARAFLGQALFFDKRISSDGDVSCASCHVPGLGGDDGDAVSTGVGGLTGTRNAPTVLNSGLNSVQFWDGRAASLEAQALGPMVNGVEMGNADHADVVAILQSIGGYAPLFDAAFGPGTTIDIDLVVKAIAAFERTLLTPNSPFDRYLAGETSALNADQIAGMQLFESLGCTECHSGPSLSLQGTPGQLLLKRFPRFSSSPYVAQYDLVSDLGRQEVTGIGSDRSKWKVPTLRNIALTAPYFHNGSVATLEEAVRVMYDTQISNVEDPDGLSTTEVAQLVAFLESLTGELPDVGPIAVSSTPPAQVPMLAPLASTCFVLSLLAAATLIRRRRRAPSRVGHGK